MMRHQRRCLMKGGRRQNLTGCTGKDPSNDPSPACSASTTDTARLQSGIFRRMLVVIACMATVLSAYTGAHAGWLMAKASIAQHLLDVSWSNSIRVGAARKPWAWADSRTVARLQVPSIDVSLIVLDNASGEALAFGPGLAGGDPHRVTSNTLAIGGHRDTHLKFLQHLPVGARLLIETLGNPPTHYQLVDKQIVDSRLQSLALSTQMPGLVLITCYPFNARQTGGPLRMVARAVRVETKPYAAAI